MIHEEICTYELCKLAKEKGFPVKEIECWYCEYDGRPTKEIVDEQQHPIINQSLLQRWLREEKGVHIVIESEPTTTTSSNMLFQWIINYNSDGECYDCYNDIRAYPSYEKTLESALKFALENLV